MSEQGFDDVGALFWQLWKHADEDRQRAAVSAALEGFDDVYLADLCCDGPPCTIYAYALGEVPSPASCDAFIERLNARTGIEWALLLLTVEYRSPPESCTAGDAQKETECD